MEYALTFTEQQMRVINAALVELPFKVVAPVIQSINEQIASAGNSAGGEPGREEAKRPDTA